MERAIGRLIKQGTAVAVCAAVLVATIGLGAALGLAVDPVPVLSVDGAGDGHSAKLEWTESVGAFYYGVQYKLLADSTWLDAADALTATSYTVTGLSTGLTYEFRVNAQNASHVTIATSSVVQAVITDIFQPVYRFYNFTNNTHFFTSSADEADHVIATWPNVFRYEGVAYSTNPSNNTQPLYRFYNVVSASHFYTASEDEKNQVLATWPNVYTLDGQAYAVNPGPVPDSVPVYRFFNFTNGSHFYTSSAEEADMVIATWPTVYRFEGPAFWLGQ